MDDDLLDAPKKLVVIDLTVPGERSEQQEHPYTQGPPPPEELGRNLHTLDDARRWLFHPSNWIDSNYWIIRWDGFLAKISRSHAHRLMSEPWDTGLLEVVIRDQYLMRHPEDQAGYISGSIPLAVI